MFQCFYIFYLWGGGGGAGRGLTHRRSTYTHLHKPTHTHTRQLSKIGVLVTISDEQLLLFHVFQSCFCSRHTVKTSRCSNDNNNDNYPRVFFFGRPVFIHLPTGVHLTEHLDALKQLLCALSDLDGFFFPQLFFPPQITSCNSASRIQANLFNCFFFKTNLASTFYRVYLSL